MIAKLVSDHCIVSVNWAYVPFAAFPIKGEGKGRKGLSIWGWTLWPNSGGGILMEYAVFWTHRLCVEGILMEYAQSISTTYFCIQPFC